MTYSLKVEGMNFSYPRRSDLITNLDLTLRPGATVLLGPNGAGKTTLISLLATLRKPNHGSIILKNQSNQIISSQKVTTYRRHIAWLPQRFEPVAGLTVKEHVTYSGWLKGMNKKSAEHVAPLVLERVGLQQLADSKVNQLSGGQKQRLGIAGALVHDASVILLDEPSAGLDPLQRERLQQTINDLKTDRTVLVSTHQTEDIDGVYDFVVVLAQGKIYFDGTLEDFIARSPNERLDRHEAIRHVFSTLVPAEV